MAVDLVVIFVRWAVGVLSLLRSCHVHIHARNFDQRRISEYLNHIRLGLVSGCVFTLFVSHLADDDGDAVRLSAAALGFLAGYNTKYLFQTLERIAQALFPRINISTVRKATAYGF